MTLKTRILIAAVTVAIAALFAGWHWAGSAQAGGCTRGNYCSIKACVPFNADGPGAVYFEGRYWYLIQTSWGTFKQVYQPIGGIRTYSYFAATGVYGDITWTCEDVLPL